MSDGGIVDALARLEAGQQRLEAGQNELKDGLAITRDDLAITRADIMARIDRLQDLVHSLRDDIGVNFGATDRVRDAHDGTRRELASLGEQVSLMERQIMRLQSDVRALKGEP